MKRAFDIVVSATALLILAPVIAVVGLSVFLTIGRPVLFRQFRPGLHGMPFLMLKFRTMRDENDASGQPLSDASRMTDFGKWLRSTSLDELPELWNVLKGDMSLVGPRPLLMEYLELYNTDQLRRLDVRPGITGWAQVKGRNAISWEKRFKLDVWYVDNRTFALDLRILAMTLVRVLKREGISANGDVTMPKFRGNP